MGLNMELAKDPKVQFGAATLRLHKFSPDWIEVTLELHWHPLGSKINLTRLLSDRQISFFYLYLNVECDIISDLIIEEEILMAA